MGPLEKTKPWSMNGVKGVYNFLTRVFRFVLDKNNYVDEALEEVTNVRELHKLIKKVTEDIESMNFNTAISALMILAGEMEKEAFILKKDFLMLIQLLAPFAPHVSE